MFTWPQLCPLPNKTIEIKEWNFLKQLIIFVMIIIFWMRQCFDRALEKPISPMQAIKGYMESSWQLGPEFITVQEPQVAV